MIKQSIGERILCYLFEIYNNNKIDNLCNNHEEGGCGGHEYIHLEQLNPEIWSPTGSPTSRRRKPRNKSYILLLSLLSIRKICQFITWQLENDNNNQNTPTHFEKLESWARQDRSRPRPLIFSVSNCEIWG